MKRKVLFMVAALALLMAACSTDTKVLPKKPVITDPLSLQSNQYPQGATAIPLTVTATTRDKKAKLSYQWYSNTKNSNKNGTRIAGLDSGDYTPSTETIGEFYYYVEVTSTLSKEKAKTTSDVAVITVVDPAEIPQINTSNGKGGEVESGEDILLNVKLPESIEDLLELDEELEVLYQWYDNGNRNSNVGGTAINGANESSYLPPSDKEGTTYYYAVVTVKNKVTGEVVKTMTTSPQKVTVIINTIIIDPTKENARLPVIEDQPEVSSKGYFIGVTAEPLTVKARVSDGGVLTYQWYRNTEDSTTGGERISGVTRASYIPPTDELGVMYYFVVITNTIEDNQDGGQKTATRTSQTVKVEVKKGKDAQTPVIIDHPQEAFYNKDQPASALTVTVDPVTDGGTLTYQWYSKLDEDSSVGGTKVSTAESYTPLTDTKSSIYYFVEVTNTIADNGDGGNKSASVRSNAAYVGVGIKQLNISGFTGVRDKPYDGTDTAELNGTATINVGGDRVTLVKGTVKFDQVDVGTNIHVTLENWYITGEDSDSYKLIIPKDLRGNIVKATGAAINTMTLGTPTSSSVTVTEATLATETGQGIEYARGATANIAAGSLEWQDSPTLSGLSASTNYFIYARSKETSNYNAGTYKVSAQITTAIPRVTLEANGGVSSPFVSVTKGQKLNKSSVSDPTKETYKFDYWYTDAALTTPYDFDAVVNDNFTLYAKWVSNAEITMMRDSKKMEWIQGGWFTMGSPVGEPGRVTNETQHRVTLSGFWMTRHQITQEKWMSVMRSIPNYTNPSYWKTGIESDTPEQLPVDQVSWYDCLVFCNKLSIEDGLTPAYKIYDSTNPGDWGAVPTSNNADWNAVQIVSGSTGYRLPTEAQWEYACRAGTTTAYSTGATIVDGTGWYSVNSTVNGTQQAHKVGLKPTENVGPNGGNQWGLYDMHGNALEWCWDWYGTYATTNQINPMGVTGIHRVMRGGSWYSAASIVRSAFRAYFDPFQRNADFGLRLVKP